MDPDPILQNLGRVLKGVDEGETRAFLRGILDASAIHLAGAGRSALVVRAFAMRLTELGLRAHVMGEASTPACRHGDLLIVCSGSGRAPALIVAAEEALRAGARLAVLTAAVVAPLTRLAHLKVLLPPVLVADPRHGQVPPNQPPDERVLVSALRTLFEQAALLYLDSLVPWLMENTRQTVADLEARRPNLD